MKLHAFIAMTFGTKPGADGKSIDFNRIYNEYFKPALEAADIEVFRANEETLAGDIHTGMFQGPLISDLVEVDLTVDTPNVWFELSGRHALCSRGVVLVQNMDRYQPFDIVPARKLHTG